MMINGRFGRIFKSHVFGSPAIISCDLELNMFILQNEEKLFLTSYPKVMHGILGRYSLLLVSGDVHKKLRQLGVNFINSSKSSPKFLLCVDNLTRSLMESWHGREQVSFLKEVKTVSPQFSLPQTELQKLILLVVKMILNSHKPSKWVHQIRHKLKYNFINQRILKYLDVKFFLFFFFFFDSW